MNKVRPGTIFSRKIFAGEPRLGLGAVFVVAMGLLGYCAQDARAQDNAKTETKTETLKKIELPKQGEFVRDLGNVLDDDDEKEIHSFCESLLKAKNTQIFILTVNSTVDFGGKGADVISFARQIRSQWDASKKPVVRMSTRQRRRAGITEDEEGKEKNKLILFVVSKNEKQAHIILRGKGWDRNHDEFVRLLLLNEVNPQVNGADYYDGIWKGIQGLDVLSRGESDSTFGWLIGWLWTVFVYFLLFAVLVFLIVAMRRPVIFEKAAAAVAIAYESLREVIGKKQ